MAIDPTVITTQNVGSLPTSAINLTDKFPHEVSGYLKQSSVNDLAVFIAAYVGATSTLVFNTTKVTTGQTLPTTTKKEFLFVGAGTFTNVGGGATITTTQGLNVLTSNGSIWTLSVEVPVTVTFNGLVQTIRQGFTGTVTSEGALFDALELIKADVIKSAPFYGAITPSSTATGTGSAYWLATQAGTYTNFAGFVVSANSFAVISRSAAGVFSISQTALVLTDYIQESNLTYKVSKNIFDKNKTVSGYINGDTGILTAASGTVTTIEIPVDVTKKTITISGLGLEHYGLGWVFRNDAGTAISNSYTDGNVAAFSIIAPAANNYSTFQITLKTTHPTDSTNINNVQIEYGAATSYESYSSEIVKINGKEIIGNINTSSESFFPISTNIFDKLGVVQGKEVYSDGTFQPEANSMVSGFIELPTAATSIYISGLTAYTGLPRYLAFYDSAKVLTVAYPSTDGILNTDIEKSFPIPLGSKFVSFSIYQRKTSAETINLNIIQVEIGDKKTVYTPYELGVSTVGGNKIYASNKLNSTALKTKGLSMLCFGDSITETATVSDDGVTYTEGTRSNWVTFSKAVLGIGTLFNYAKSGGNWRDDGGLEFRQKISNQITAAINNSRPADIIVVSCGTNSGDINLGSYATAMGKTTLNSLDRTFTYEAIRWALWALRLNYPNAKCFIATPIQRADREPLPNLSNAIKQMANRYNFIVMDAEFESGIVREFETTGVAGRYLYDGLHPNTAGQVLMSNYFNNKILNNI